MASDRDTAIFYGLPGDLISARGEVLARCLGPACGAATVIRLGEGIGRAVARASLARLQDQLRCTCGSRRGVFAPCPAEYDAPPAPGRRLYLFHA